MSKQRKKVQIILPDGKHGGQQTVGDFIRLKNENFWRRVNSDGTLTKIEDGKNGTFDYKTIKNKKVQESTERRLRLANKVNPRLGYPKDIIDGLGMYIDMKGGEATEQSYTVAPTLLDSVAHAAWKKYLGLNYDPKFLPKGIPDDRGGFGDNTVRLPAKLEAEIPVDTTFLKLRIKANKDYLNSSIPKSDKVIKALKFGIDLDEYALQQLRHTYRTGEPVGMHEYLFNSRKLINDGIVDWKILDHTPFNVFQYYNIRYDKDTNGMYYSDTYGFDNSKIPFPANLFFGSSYDKFLGGIPFRFRGYIDLNKK